MGIKHFCFYIWILYFQYTGLWYEIRTMIYPCKKTCWMGFQGTYFFFSSVDVLLDFVRNNLLYKNTPCIFAHWAWARKFLRLLQYWQCSLTVTYKLAAENNTDVNEWKSCNSKSIILLSLNSDACGSLKNTKELLVVFFFQIFLKGF